MDERQVWAMWQKENITSHHNTWGHFYDTRSVSQYGQQTYSRAAEAEACPSSVKPRWKAPCDDTREAIWKDFVPKNFKHRSHSSLQLKFLKKSYKERHHDTKKMGRTWFIFISFLTVMCRLHFFLLYPLRTMCFCIFLGKRYQICLICTLTHSSPEPSTPAIYNYI